MMENFLRAGRAMLVALLASWSGVAEGQSHDDQLRNARVLTADFLRYHPDIKHRLEGLRYLDEGNLALASTEFRKAARYADKVSQAMVAEIIWNSATSNAERSLAYAWMDLAAERGYQVFVAKREQYWAELDEAGRSAALGVGEKVYAEYGDDVAKRRLEDLLKRGRLAITGSRVGFVGPLEIKIPGPGGLLISISGEEYYDNKLWRPNQYFDWQDRTWGGLPVGEVQVGELQSAAEESQANGDR